MLKYTCGGMKPKPHFNNSIRAHVTPLTQYGSSLFPSPHTLLVKPDVLPFVCACRPGSDMMYNCRQCTHSLSNGQACVLPVHMSEYRN